MNIAAAFHNTFAAAVTNEFPEALGLIELAQEVITEVADYEDLDNQSEAFFEMAERTAKQEGLEITAIQLHQAYAAHA